MTHIWQSRILRLQLVLWIFAPIGIVSILHTSISSEVRTIIASFAFVALLIINALHFFKIDDPIRLNQITAYISPSVLISLLLQVSISAMLIERFGLADLRSQAGQQSIQAIVAVVYVLGGVFIGLLNFAPALYRFQELQKKLTIESIASGQTQFRIIRALIEKFMLSFDITNDPADIENWSPEKVRETIKSLTESSGNQHSMSELIMVDRWINDKIKEREKSEQPTLYLWGTLISALAATSFSIVASILGVLNLLQSLVG